ncbi:MAG TPA: tRNA (adenosine(37)-N6)-threonylcarbamoyltransferase complex dimerization subunit type 1 TsaB, partial [Microbacterium sp.]|nr:tRNA (adenosine(37)-N6)-threonylcarbamoyltransferase complex dimerization subunit type 1 TsaB [Microbacterium sp.]
DDDGLPLRATEPALAHRDDLDARLAAHGAARLDVIVVSAAMLAVVAARALAAGRTVGPHEPLYLRAPDVTPPKQVVR